MANLYDFNVNIQNTTIVHMQQLMIVASRTGEYFRRLTNESVVVSKALRQMGAPISMLKEQMEKLKSQRNMLPIDDLAKARLLNEEISALEKAISELENTTKKSELSLFDSQVFDPKVIKNLLGTILNYGMADETQSVKLAALVGTEKADQVSNDLSQYSAQTPYNKQSLMDGAVQLAQGGIGAEAITPMLQNVGDIALGDESKMSQFAEILARTNKEGRLTTDSLETLKGMGFDPLSEIANTTGKDINSLYTDLENSKIGIEDLTEAMETATGAGGRFHNKAAELGNTLGGQLTMFTNKVNNAMRGFYQIIEPIVTKLVEFAGAAIDASVNGLGWLIDKIKEGDPLITGIAIAIGTVITALILYETYLGIVSMGMGILSTATAIWGTITAIATSPIFLTILAIVTLIAVIGYLIYAFDGWGEAWDNTLNAVQSLWSGCMNSIKYGWGVVYDTLMDGIDGVMIAWYKLKGLWDEDGAAKELTVIQKRSDERKEKLKETREAARKDFIDAGESTKKAFNSIHSNGKNLSDMVDEYLPKGLNLGAPNNLSGKGSAKTDINTNPVLNPGTTSNITNSGTSHITINVQDLIGVLNVNREGFRESVNDIEEGLTDALLRVLGTAVTAGSN